MHVLCHFFVIGAGRFHADMGALRIRTIFGQPFSQGRVPTCRVVKYFATNLAFYQQGDVQLVLAYINSDNFHLHPLVTLPLYYSLRASLFTQAQASDTVRTHLASRWRELYLRSRLLALGMTQLPHPRFSSVLENLTQLYRWAYRE